MYTIMLPINKDSCHFLNLYAFYLFFLAYGTMTSNQVLNRSHMREAILVFLDEEYSLFDHQV